MCFLHLEGTSLPVFIHVPIKTCMFVRNSKIKPHASSSNLDIRSSYFKYFCDYFEFVQNKYMQAMDKCVENTVDLIVQVALLGQKGVVQDIYNSRHINSAVVHLI